MSLNKNVYCLGLSSLLGISILLSGCDDGGSNLSEDENFTADKTKVINNIRLDKDKRSEYSNLVKNASKTQNETIKLELHTDVEKYYHLKNLDKTVNVPYDYVFIVESTPKFDKLYKDVIIKLAENNQDKKILVYFAKNSAKTADFPTNKSNVDTLYLNDSKNKDVVELNKLTVEKVPTFIALSDKKVYLTLTGYYESNVLDDKLRAFDKGVIK